MVTRSLLILIVLNLVLTASCGRPEGFNPEDRTLLFTSAIVDGGNPLDERQQGIAYRICFALRAKRFHYQGAEPQDDLKTFRYDHSIRRCDNAESVKDDIELSFKANGEELEYQYSSVDKLFYGPLTDKQGLLAPICEKILQGETSTNVFVDEGKAYELSFFSQINGDGVLIKFGEMDGENEFQYISSFAHYYYILTDTTVSGDLLGLVHRAQEVRACDNGTLETATISSKDL